MAAGRVFRGDKLIFMLPPFACRFSCLDLCSGPRESIVAQEKALAFQPWHFNAFKTTHGTILATEEVLSGRSAWVNGQVFVSLLAILKLPSS